MIGLSYFVTKPRSLSPSKIPGAFKSDRSRPWEPTKFSVTKPRNLFPIGDLGRVSLNLAEIPRGDGLGGFVANPPILFPAQIPVAIIFKRDRNLPRELDTMDSNESP